jgi:hypothetical protein
MGRRSYFVLIILVPETFFPCMQSVLCASLEEPNKSPAIEALHWHSVNDVVISTRLRLAPQDRRIFKVSLH